MTELGEFSVQIKNVMVSHNRVEYYPLVIPGAQTTLPSFVSIAISPFAVKTATRKVQVLSVYCRLLNTADTLSHLIECL